MVYKYAPSECAKPCLQSKRTFPYTRIVRLTRISQRLQDAPYDGLCGRVPKHHEVMGAAFVPELIGGKAYRAVCDFL